MSDIRFDLDPMKRVFGLETEYGITAKRAETVDVVAESIELVRRYTEHGALMKWDYELEDPHLDARGFRARELLQDTDESAYYEIDKNRPLSFEEIKSDLVLSNGARFYNDHAHPEYSTPECTTPSADRGAGQSGRADPGGMRAAPESEFAGRPGSSALQEQHRFRRPQLRLPRQLSDEARCAMGPHRRWHAAVSGHPADLRRRRQDGHGSGERQRVSPAFFKFRSGRIFSACW